MTRRRWIALCVALALVAAAAIVAVVVSRTTWWQCRTSDETATAFTVGHDADSLDADVVAVHELISDIDGIGEFLGHSDPMRNPTVQVAASGMLLRDGNRITFVDSDAETAWSRKVDEATDASVSLRSAVALGDDEVTGFASADGDTMWCSEADGDALVSDGSDTVIAAERDDNRVYLNAFDSDQGKKKWSARTAEGPGSRIDATQVVATGGLVALQHFSDSTSPIEIRNPATALSVFDAATGQPLWQLPSTPSAGVVLRDLQIVDSPWTPQPTVLGVVETAADRRTGTETDTGKSSALVAYLRDGSEQWRRPLTPGTQLQVVGGTALLTVSEGGEDRLLGLNVANGREVLSATAPGTGRFSVSQPITALPDGALLAAIGEGRFARVEADGTANVAIELPRQAWTGYQLRFTSNGNHLAVAVRTPSNETETVLLYNLG